MAELARNMLSPDAIGEEQKRDYRKRSADSAPRQLQNGRYLKGAFKKGILIAELGLN